jgi:hypothetical protein
MPAIPDSALRAVGLLGNYQRITHGNKELHQQIASAREEGAHLQPRRLAPFDVRGAKRGLPALLRMVNTAAVARPSLLGAVTGLTRVADSLASSAYGRHDDPNNWDEAG